MWAGYAASALVVAVGLGLALWLGASVLGIWVGIVMLLFPAFLVPFALRWFWARFNGAGFVLSIASGFAASVWFALTRPAGWNEATQFLAVAAVSAAAAVTATLATARVTDEGLRNFYARIRPFGLWPRAWRSADGGAHRGELVLAAAALVWQLLTFLLPMGAVLGMWSAVTPAAALWAALAWYLWRAPETEPAVLPASG